MQVPTQFLSKVWPCFNLGPHCLPPGRVNAFPSVVQHIHLVLTGPSGHLLVVPHLSVVPHLPALTLSLRTAIIKHWQVPRGPKLSHKLHPTLAALWLQEILSPLCAG